MSDKDIAIEEEPGAEEDRAPDTEPQAALEASATPPIKPAEEAPVPRVRVSRREIWSNRLRYFLLGVAIVCIVSVGYLILTRGVGQPAEVTVLTLTPTYTSTPTLTPTATQTRRPPTETPTPGPSPTPLPPFLYKVQPGDTWLGLAIRYDVSLESVLALNDQADSDFIQEGLEMLIPWPTYTPTPDPTLVPTLEVIDELETDQCREHVVQAGETLFAIAAQYEVGARLLEQVNGITNPDLVKQGQRLCIPLVTPGPPPSPTFGPSPTPEDEPLHPAPQLLYPPAGNPVPPNSQRVTLQWTVVGFLDPDELYMVEIRDLGRPDSRARRGFSRTTTWQLSEDLRPAVGQNAIFAWRVSVVRGEGEPTSDDFRWERSGLASGWQTYLWMGVEPDTTPTPTP